jgi:HK97 family phage prohead protease
VSGAETGTERLHRYWVHGEGAAKIGWGSPGDFDRCVRHLGKYIADPQGYCNLAHHAALGIYPATHAKEEHAGRADMSDAKKPYGDVTYADPKNGKYPVDTEEHARAAWSYINQAKNAGMYPMNGVTLSEVKGRIRAACKKFGIDISDSGDSGSRYAAPPADYMRLYPLEDIHIVRSADEKDGRIVEAYATVFDEPAQIADHEGHYIETIDPAAFNKVLADVSRSRRGLAQVKVLYNHGRTIDGSASDKYSMPIGVPVEIRPEARGLLTRTRYSKTATGEEILALIEDQAITSQSFTGRIVRSDPQLRRGDRHRPDSAGNLRTVRRTELGLREYGPVLWPAYSGAEILGVRMSTPGSGWEPDGEPDAALAPDEEAAPGEPLARTGDEHSARYHQHALYVLRSKEARERAGLVW